MRAIVIIFCLIVTCSKSQTWDTLSVEEKEKYTFNIGIYDLLTSKELDCIMRIKKEYPILLTFKKPNKQKYLHINSFYYVRGTEEEIEVKVIDNSDLDNKQMLRWVELMDIKIGKRPFVKFQINDYSDNSNTYITNVKIKYVRRDDNLVIKKILEKKYE